MNILVSSDKKYLPITATMLYSLSIQNKENVNVWFLYHGIEQYDRDRFSEYLYRKCGIMVTFLEVDDTLFNSIHAPLYIKHISMETYYRLIAQFLLPDTLDRILWMDSDIIVKGDIGEFYEQNLDAIPLVACENMGEGEGMCSNKYRLGLKKESIYFNAGVLLLNLKYLRTHTNMGEILQFCNDNIDKIKLQDQDILNLMFDGMVRVWSDQRYNCLANSPQSFISPDICERCAVIHYAGWQKPWKIRWQDNNSKYYWNVRKKEGRLMFNEQMIWFWGTLWYWINGNRWLTCLLAPYYWMKARLLQIVV